MKEFTLQSTSTTPFVLFSADKGELEIKGRSIDENSVLFWNKLSSWLDAYLLNPQALTVVKFDLEYFNISSSKCILHFISKLNTLYNQGYAAKVEWHYHHLDEEMFEVGQDYAFMLKVPFEFKEYTEEELAEAI